MAVAAVFLGSRRRWDGTEGVGAVRCEREGVESVAHTSASSKRKNRAGLEREGGNGAARGRWFVVQWRGVHARGTKRRPRRLGETINGSECARGSEPSATSIGEEVLPWIARARGG